MVNALQTSGFLFPQENAPINFSFTAPIVPFSFTQKDPFPPIQLPDDLFEKEWQPRLKVEEPPQPDFFFCDHFEKLEKETSILPLATIPNYLIVDPASLNASFPEKKREAHLILIDQRRAHTRIIFERFEKNCKIHTEALLIQETVEVTTQEEACLLKELPLLKKMGLEIDQTGPKLFTISAVPDFFKRQALSQFIKDFIHQAKEARIADTVQKEKEKQLAILSVRHAISADKTLSMQEAKNLIKELMECKMPFQDPKGQEIFAFIMKEELKTFFK
ncbi:MAG TPA: hypothetical protein PLC42_06700 [Parachlamydiaceae bacterium]|nr:hypothetical protein [Parachlamydiaceae bacterium]